MSSQGRAGLFCFMLIRTPSLTFRAAPQRRTRTTRIVCHHTAGPERQTVHDIHRYHLTLPEWLGIGYNLVQHEDGEWWHGRGPDAVGSHARGYNATSIGICLTGNFETAQVPEDRWKSLVEMCAWLCKRYDLTYTDIVGHRELPGAATLCPGKHMDMSRLRHAVRARLDSHPTDDPRTLFRVQVGAFSKRENAEARLAEIRAAGWQGAFIATDPQ